MTREAVIVDAVRTPLGRRDGFLKDWHPVDLLAYALRGLAERNKLDLLRQLDEQTANRLGHSDDQTIPDAGRVLRLLAELHERRDDCRHRRLG